MKFLLDHKRFFAVYANKELAAYIKKCAYKKTRQIDLQEDIQQQAWLAIMESDDSCTIGDLKEIVRKAIHAAYMRESRQWKKQEKAREFYAEALNEKIMEPGSEDNYWEAIREIGSKQHKKKNKKNK